MEFTPDGYKIKKPSMAKRLRKNPWIISTFILGTLIILLLVLPFSTGLTGKTISKNKAAELVLGFVESQTGEGAEVVDVSLESGLYEVTILFEGSEVPLYLTADGEKLVQGVIPLSVINQQTQTPEPPEVTKSNVPEVELFVMTHCPYGTQAEKGLIPTMKVLGDTMNAKIRFVHYFMHDPEETETSRQVCIREEQPDKFLDYLECFLEDGDSDRCLTEVGIDKVAMETCISNGNADTYYAEDSALSEGYGVRGSPALVINGEIISSGRDPASYLDTICQAFNEAPEECGETLSSATPTPMWGWEATGSATNAQC